MSTCRRASEKHGFATMPKVLTREEVARLLDGLTDLPRSRAGIRHALGLPSVAALARVSRLLEIAPEILGFEALPFRATLFDESPDANWLVVWHQDTALPLREGRIHRAGGFGPPKQVLPTHTVQRVHAAKS